MTASSAISSSGVSNHLLRPAPVPKAAAIAAERTQPVEDVESGPKRPNLAEIRETLLELSGELVSAAFLQPIFSTMRESTFGADTPLSPGAGEKAFAPLLHQHLATAVSSASRFSLADTLVDRLAPYRPEPAETLAPDDASATTHIDKKA